MWAGSRVVVEIRAGRSREPAHMYKCSNCFHSHFSSSSLSLSQSQTLRQKEVKQLERPKGSCQTVSCQLHADSLLLFCYHVDICAWLCRGTHVDQSSLYDPFVDMRCTLLLLFILLSLPVSLLFFFFFALYFSPRPCATLSDTLTTRVFPRLSVHVKIIWGAKKEKNLVQRWNLSE